MAITKLKHMKAAKKGSASSHLRNTIDYILQNHKVARSEDGIALKGTQGCFIDHAYEEMIQTKRMYGKEDGRQGYHFILSFKPGEVTREQVWKITQDFVKEYLPGYEVVYSIHDDKPHLHSHIVFNSVNYNTGLKYHYANGDWERIIQPLVDKLCMKYDAPPLQYHVDEYDEDGVKKEYYHYSKNFNWTKENKADIDDCIRQSQSWEDFVGHMKKKGYTFHYGKYVSIRKPGMQRARRLKEKTVGMSYTPEGIIERILIRNNDYRMNSVGILSSNTTPLPDLPKRKRRTFKPYVEMDFDEKVMVKHMLRIRNAIPEYRITPGDWYADRKVAELHRTERKLLVMKKYDIHSLKDVESALQTIKKQMADLKKEQKMGDSRIEAWGEVLEAFESIREIAEFYGLDIETLSEADLKSLLAKGREPASPAFRTEQTELTPEETGQLKKALQVIEASGESLKSVTRFVYTVEQNNKTIANELKQLKQYKSILQSMKKKEEAEQEQNRKQKKTRQQNRKRTSEA